MWVWAWVVKGVAEREREREREAGVSAEKNEKEVCRWLEEPQGNYLLIVPEKNAGRAVERLRETEGEREGVRGGVRG